MTLEEDPRRQIDSSELEIYKVLNEIQRYEGAGIWSRFNIIVTVHVALFAVVAFLFNSKEKEAHYLVLFVSAGGVLISVWGLYVLQKLWAWHLHWKKCLIQIEMRFPYDEFKIFTGNKRLKKNKLGWKRWVLSYTQPFLLIILLVWLSLCLIIGLSFYSRDNMVEGSSIGKSTFMNSSLISKFEQGDRNDLSVSCIVVDTEHRVLLQLRDERPDIPYPSHWALVAGWVKQGEFPRDAVRREMKEELRKPNGDVVVPEKITYLASYLREGKWYEHLFMCEIQATNKYVTNEGRCIEPFSISRVAHLEPFADHHKMYFAENIDIINDAINNNDRKQAMNKISDYADIIEIGVEKDYAKLENGRGFVLPQKGVGTCALTPVEAARFVAVLEFKDGKPRGNHYHEKKVEYMSVLNGQLECELYPVEKTSESVHVQLKPGQTLRIQPGCVHTFTAKGDNVFALEYSPQAFEKADVIVVSE